VPVRVLTGTSGARVFIAAALEGATTLTLDLGYTRSSGDAPVIVSLTLPVPSTPGAPA
jgi:hypothetical protein